MDRSPTRKLRNGQETSDYEQFLLAKPAEDIVEYMMNDPAFGLSLLDFNLHFLGFRSEKMKLPVGDSFGGDVASPDLYSTYSSAVKSAHNAVAGGNYLEILNMGTEPYLIPLQTGVIKGGEEEVDLDLDAFRKERLRALDDFMERLAVLAATLPKRSDFCSLKNEKYIYIPYDSSLLYTIWQWAFEPLKAPCEFESGGSDGGADDDDIPSPGDLPDDGMNDPVMPASIVDAVATVKQNILMVKDLYAKLDAAVYAPKVVSDLKTFELGQFGFSADALKQISNQWFWNNFRNSSTNMNRKRAAYVLKRFFCDDLTPIGIEVPDVHAGAGRHATDPGCQSCHYKLDPMAGFFRNNGELGFDFKNQTSILFDDFASKERADYIKQWRSDDNTHWNVGYVRSVTNPEMNDMPGGDPGVDDLFVLINKAPEVKQCLIQNLFHFLVGDEVALDRGYLSELTQNFIDQSETNSATAIRDSVKKITTSLSFVEESPEKGVCYDYPADYDATGKPPCEIAYILRESCQQCHSATNNQGGLDLETWRVDIGFSHVDADGKRIELVDTLKLIDLRLTTADSEKRMPLAKYMSPHDRETLYKWVKSVEENL